MLLASSTCGGPGTASSSSSSTSKRSWCSRTSGHLPARRSRTPIRRSWQRLCSSPGSSAASPFETWVIPTFHQGSFGDLADEEVEYLAAILIRVLATIRRACGDPDFNLVMYSAPTNGHTSAAFHWHIKIVPKLSTQAGFELGSAMSINTVLPEDAATSLRNALAPAVAPRLG